MQSRDNKSTKEMKQLKIKKQLKNIKQLKEMLAVFNRIGFKTKLILFLIMIIFLLITTFLFLSQLPDPLFSKDYSTIVLDEKGEYLRIFLNNKQQWIFPDEAKEIPERLKIAVTQFEDKRFEKHHGIDTLALIRAVYQNLKNRESISGASTITMQLARLMEPKERTIKNKLVEMMKALRIEMKYSKDQILNFYLLHAPYGSNIIGYRTASYKYFAKDPGNLSWAEAATLAILPNNPANVNPMKNQERLKERRDELLLSLYEDAVIDRSTYKLATAESVPVGQYSFPLSAPHLAEKLRRNQSEDIIKTTINKRLQDRSRNTLLNYLEDIKKVGINNAALLISDTKSGEVKAYLGSHDYFDNENLGKIDGVQMRRSTGSTLKPFLYALAMDEGLIIQESRLKDIPINYGGYTPHNANRRFDGIVKADDALIRSLNAPAVNLLYQYGVNNFYSFLKEAGIRALFREANDYGLSLILGGSESSLWELSQLYRG
ncbi:MAG: penicillin-binding protein 1C, partial [Halanaerobiales bacterium]